MSLLGSFYRDTLYGNRLTAVLRMAMGALFIYAGVFKILDPTGFGAVVGMYRLLPDVLVPCAAIAIPPVEVLAGFLLLAGFRTRAASLIALALMAVFIIAVGINAARGAVFDCGCFELGRFGISEQIGWGLVARDAVFFLILIVLFRAERHVLSLEARIERESLNDL